MSDNDPTQFPVVGVGASAGGLAATSELLRHLGATPGLAVVVIHHLDPEHESGLVDILARVAAMPVCVAQDGLPLEINHAYVVPPNAGLGLEGGKLRLTPRIVTGGLHLPVNRFFQALAAERGVHGLGVVLSGTGSDGSEGIEAIKGQGGITFAQDASAEHRGMPQSAIATGCVDFILPPPAIARELLRIAESRPAPPSTDDEPAFQRVLQALRKASGIDFASYKRSTLRRRVQRRIMIKRLPSLAAYAEMLEHDPEEALILSDEVLIHVTSYFRDPEVFDALRIAVFPKLVEARPPHQPIRVWVPGCSSGEEVYSLAVALLEFLEEAGVSDLPIKLFGTDLSAGAIDKARAGRYPSSIERDVSPGRLQRFFVPLEGGYQIRQSVRDLCVFAKHDATRDPPFAGMDLVSCRNLMIYLGPTLQNRILPIFHYSLKATGFLVLGTSESIHSFPGFVPLDAKNRIYARTAAAPRLLFDFFEQPHSGHAPALPPGDRPAGPSDVSREADRLVLAEFAPPGVVISDDLAILQFRGRTAPFLEPAPGTASFELMRMARNELRIPLRQAIDEARAEGRATRKTGLRMVIDERPRQLELAVIPFRAGTSPQKLYVVLFCDVTPRQLAAEVAPIVPVVRTNLENQLRQELDSTRDYLESVIEQLEASNEELKAANEEIVSSNEELHSTNEEMQMAKEELQATNEELGMVNEEMTVRNLETGRINDDLFNVLSSVENPIIIFGRDGSIRRFTPSAANLFHLVTGDVGRPISDLEPVLPVDLTAIIGEVIERLTPVQRGVCSAAGRWYQLTVRPYKTRENRIDGAVLSAVDVDEAKKAAQLVDGARKYAESVVDTVRECLLVLDGELRVRSANRAFLKTFGVTLGEIVGRPLPQLAGGEWLVPELAARLAALGENDSLEGYRVERELHQERRQSFILSARPIQKTSSILVALDDVTERERAEKAAQRLALSFREMLTSAGEAIVMTDATGRILFANHMASEVFGYTSAELAGLKVEALLPERLRDRHARDREGFNAAPSRRPMGRDRELSGRRKDGREFPVEVGLSPMQGDDGMVTVSFITDITQRRASEARLREHQAKLQQMAFDNALAEERERRRIAAGMHDHIGQSLALVQMKLSSLRESVAGAPRAALDEAISLLSKSVSDTRTLIFELSPPVLYDLGLREALSWLAEDVEKRYGIRVDVHDDGLEKGLDDGAAALVFRAVRELLMNVLKHAKVPNASVSLRRCDDHMEIDVEDKGVGFDTDDLARRGFGLFSVREQIDRLGGALDVTSAPRQGTRVSLRVPLKEAEKTP